MQSSYNQVLTIAILTLNIIRAVALNFSSIGSDIENGVESVGSSIDSEASKLLGDLETDFDNFESEVESDLISALANSNGTLAQFTLGHQTTPPISARLATSGVQSNITVGLYCASCAGASQPPAFDFASQNYSGWDESWLGFALDSFEALFEMDIDLSAAADGELTLSLLKLITGAEGVVVEVDFQLYLVADASATMTFTTGLNLTLAQPAAIMIPALDPVVKLNESKRIGFAQEDFILAPIFNASTPKLEFSVQFSLRTVFSVTVEDINIGALYLDLPAFNLTVDTLTNALSNCQTAPTGTASDKIYAELIHLNGALVAELSYELFDGSKTGVIETWTIWDALDECYAFFPGLGSIGAVPDSSKSPLLTAPPITLCSNGSGISTTGTVAFREALKSLSRGAKAGAVIGILAAVTFIAALAWYGGRASLNHSLKNGATGAGSVWTVPGPRSSRLFSHGKGGSKLDFSPTTPVTISTPAWQTTAYDGGYFPSQDIEQRQFERQDWQIAKKEPFMTVNEAVTPAATYISIGDDHGMSTAGAEETSTIRYDPGSQSARSEPKQYERGQARPAETLGLLQKENSPVVPRKEIQRKEIQSKELKRKEVSRQSLPRYGSGSGSWEPFSTP